MAEHVEIYPIELKLDYKPKRVDFAALREGKTMELMNFFHFDGAEMTLRHITLSGVRHLVLRPLRKKTMLMKCRSPDGTACRPHSKISGHPTSKPTRLPISSLAFHLSDH